jgi:hypothetical protein
MVIAVAGDASEPVPDKKDFFEVDEVGGAIGYDNIRVSSQFIYLYGGD